MDISLFSKISGGLTITFVSANQRWGSFSTVGLSDIAYGIVGEKQMGIKMGIGEKSHRKEKESLPHIGNSSNKYSLLKIQLGNHICKWFNRTN